MTISHIADSDFLKLLARGEFISKREKEEISKYVEKSGKRVSEAIIDMAIMPDYQVSMLLADQARIPFIKVGSMKIPQRVLDMIPAKIAKDNRIVPIETSGSTLHIATSDLHQTELFQFLEKKTQMRLEISLAAESDIKDALRAYEVPLQQKLDIARQAIESQGQKEAAESISNLLNDIIYQAALEHASDIHIEPQEDEIIVRIRLDGVLKDIMFLPKTFEDVLITRIKVLANLKTDEHRAAQDGRIMMEFPDMDITLRVSIIPIYDGEKVVLRLLSTQGFLNLEGLGYSQNHLNQLREASQKSHGMILVTGPTGSGKTTTLYSVLRILNSRDVNISTIEDPIEIRLPGVNQIQVNNEANLSFANGLRSILRQDPDIVLVGEIRDTETANIGINAALTGHLVFATLHTNDAASSLPRLLEMGIEHFLVASTVNIVIAQRLVRRICPFCITSESVPAKKIMNIFEDFEAFDKEHFVSQISSLKGKSKINIYHGAGCDNCNNTGFRGRLAIAEMIDIDEEIRELVKEEALPGEIIKVARKKGMITMMEDGVLKVLQGLTTPEEVLRVTRE